MDVGIFCVEAGLLNPHVHAASEEYRSLLRFTWTLRRLSGQLPYFKQ